MNNREKERLYNLLPNVYRQLDSQQGYQLKAYLGVIEKELRALESDIDQLYDNYFVETCQEWVVPYIGDLLGIRGLHPGSPGIFSQRAYVGNTLAYRRRKGTATTLEQVAYDTTGWQARVVEFFRLLSSTQNINHPRLHEGTTCNLHGSNSLELINGPFENISHTADIKNIVGNRGKYNIRNVGIFLWRIQSYPLSKTMALPNTGKQSEFRFCQLGLDMMLFNNPITETTMTQLTNEENVPGHLRRRALYDELEAIRMAMLTNTSIKTVYFRENSPVFEIFLQLSETSVFEKVPPEEIIIMNLRNWEKPPDEKTYVISGQTVKVKISAAVDPVLGRITLPISKKDARSVVTSYCYGFSSDIGGGPYDRRHTLVDLENIPTVFGLPAGLNIIGNDMEEIIFKARLNTIITNISGNSIKAYIDSNNFQSAVLEVKQGTELDTINKAIALWLPNIATMKNVVIRVLDSGTYHENIEIHLPKDSTLVIEAANQTRPCISLNISKNIKITLNEGESNFTINGFLILGGIVIKNCGTLKLNLSHCTLVPGRTLREDGSCLFPESDSIITEETTSLTQIVIDHCITGALRLPYKLCDLTILDSIIDPPKIKREKYSYFDSGEKSAYSRPAIEKDIYHDSPGMEWVVRHAIASCDSCETFGPKTNIERSTIFGPVSIREFGLASETIFTHAVDVERSQTGCVRYCYIPGSSKLPKRFRCQPEHSLKSAKSPKEKELINKLLKPVFTSKNFGHPAYAQLSGDCPVEIRTGAEDGSEMGVFSHLKQPQRESNLRASIDDYLRFGLDAEIFYVS
ncbi:MAG: hypothetical protein OEY64_10555 [Nitrospinota bacterium]|nr:hypothetical protein [Nitrospinota bacterium]